MTKARRRGYKDFDRMLNLRARGKAEYERFEK